MFSVVKNHIGLKLILAFSALIGLSLVLVVVGSNLLFQDFGTFAIAKNEQQLKKQAANFLDAMTQEKAEKYEAVFQKIAAYSRFIARQAELKIQLADHSSKPLDSLSQRLTIHPQNGIFYNHPFSPMSILYWGGAAIPARVRSEIAQLTPFTPVLSDAKERNPEVVAAHLIMAAGWGHYYPNSEALYDLPPVSELDLRTTNNFVLAHPDKNPAKNTIWVPVYYDDVGNGLMTTASSPILGRDGSFKGVAGLDLPVNNIQQQILQSTQLDSDLQPQGLFTFLLDSRGKFISFPFDQFEKFGIANPSEQFVNSLDLLDTGLHDSVHDSIRQAAERILLTEKQTSTFMLDQEAHVISSQRLDSTGWYLVVTVPEKIFLAPAQEIGRLLTGKINNLNTQFYLLAISFLIGSILLIVIFLRSVFLRPLKQLTAAAQQVEGGDFGQDLHSRQTDEIGSLINSFGRMVNTLKRSKDLEHNYAAELEDKVSEQTLALQRQKRELEQDVARRQQVEEDLVRAKSEAEEANAAKSQFLSNITHELRTPLIGVLGMNELLTRTKLEEQQRVLVNAVQNSGNELLTMVSSILDFSKIESGTFKSENTSFTLSEAVEETVFLLLESASEKNLELICRIAPDALWKVRADQVSVRQILANLVSNAIKFTPQGEVLVAVRIDRVNTNFGYCVIEVTDTGIGMSEESLGQIFNAFVQIDNSSVRAFSGTGLGLAIVQRLVALLDGKLEVKSQLGEGSTFTVTLPLELIEPNEFLLPENMENAHILLQVENISIEETLERMLPVGDGRLHTVTNGDDAWGYLKESRAAGTEPRVVILDMKARLKNGELLYEKILAEKDLSELPIVGLCNRADLLEPQFPKMVMPLEKPVTWSQLFEVLRSCQ